MKSVQIIKSISGLRARLDQARADGQRVGFVPTMGYLHDGHGSLMKRARDECELVVVSIFVNPLQFAPDEDLASYPRDLQRDTALAQSCGVDILFVPEVIEMYPNGQVKTQVSVPELAAHWDGASRPSHFTGVATVVSKLFNIVGPCHAYFGRKDFQQLVVIRQMATDLSMPVTVVGCPTIREADGLAMSSRNSYLSPADRQAAVVIYQGLQQGKRAALAGETNPAAIVQTVTDVICCELRATIDYVAAVDRASLTVPEWLSAESLILVACWFGKTRLIDNVLIRRGDATAE